MDQFDVSPETAVVTTSYVTDQKEPILYVSHEMDEDGSVVWQFHSGNGDYSPDRLRLVRLSTILGLDGSVIELATMPVGYSARRTQLGGTWEIAPEV